MPTSPEAAKPVLSNVGHSPPCVCGCMNHVTSSTAVTVKAKWKWSRG